MNKSHKLPTAQQRAKQDITKVSKIIEALLQPGQQLSTLSPAEIYQLLAGRIENLETQLNNVIAALTKAIPVKQRFQFAASVTEFELAHEVNLSAPVEMVCENVSQKLDIDFEIDGKIVRWINAEDPDFVQGLVEMTYYRA
jgi:hypothetical protein